MVYKNVLVIGINTSKSEKNFLIEKLNDKDVNIKIAKIKDIVIQIINNVPSITVFGEDISKFDYVWLQSSWSSNHIIHILHLYLKANKIPHNKPTVHQTKLSDIFSLAQSKIAVPDTYFHARKKYLSAETTYIADNFKFPCIYKTLVGSLGQGVFQIQNQSDVDDTKAKNHKSSKFIFQQYIPNDFDYRVIVCDGVPHSVCLRIRNKDSYRNNVSLGAKEVFVPINETDSQVLDLAVKSAKILKLKWAGVDVIVDKETNRPFILEVNRRPGLTKSTVEPTGALNYLVNMLGI